jgi:hypothetical protein
MYSVLFCAFSNSGIAKNAKVTQKNAEQFCLIVFYLYAFAVKLYGNKNKIPARLLLPKNFAL